MKISRILSNVLRLHAVPYVVTALLSVAAWGFIYLLDALVAAPLIEYDITWKASEGQRTVTVEIVNLSRTNRINRLVIGFATREVPPGKFSQEGLLAVAPAAEGTESKTRIMDRGSEVQFTIVNLQPGQQFKMWASYAGIDIPELRLLDSDSPVYLHKKGLITFFIKHLISILLVGLFVLACIFAAVFVMAVQHGQCTRKINP